MAQFNITRHAFARERITITSGAVKQLTASVYNPDPSAAGNGNNTQAAPIRRKATGARVVFETGNPDVHFTEDGTDPTTATNGSGVGAIASAKDIIEFDSFEAITKFKVIALTGTAYADVVYYR